MKRVTCESEKLHNCIGLEQHFENEYNPMSSHIIYLIFLYLVAKHGETINYFQQLPKILL